MAPLDKNMPEPGISIDGIKQEIAHLKTELETERGKRASGTATMSEVVSQRGIVTPSGSVKARRLLKGHFGKVYSMHWSGNSRELVSASQDGKLIVWDAMLNIKLHAIPLRSSWVMTCAYEQQQNQLVACGGLDNLCTIYKLDNSGQPVTRSHRELVGHDGYLSSCRFIGEQSILTASGDATCLLWDIETGANTVKFSGHEQDIMSVCIQQECDPNMFVSGSCDSTAKVWDIRTGECTMTLRGHESDINSVAMFPGAKAFGTGSDDSSCRLFDIRACAQLSEFKNDSIFCGITSVEFSKSGRLLFAGYDDYNCNAWDVLGSNQKQVHQLQGHENRVSCLGVSPDGDCLATGSWDTTLKIWA